MTQNLSGRIFFQQKVEFLKSSIGFQFYALSNKDTFFDSPGSKKRLKKITRKKRNKTKPVHWLTLGKERLKKSLEY